MSKSQINKILNSIAYCMSSNCDRNQNDHKIVGRLETLSCSVRTWQLIHARRKRSTIGYSVLPLASVCLAPYTTYSTNGNIIFEFEYFSLRRGMHMVLFSTFVLVASYDKEKSTKMSFDVTMVSTVPRVVLTTVLFITPRAGWRSL